MEKQFVVTETIPLMWFRTIEGAEDYLEAMEEDGGVYDIVNLDTPCEHHKIENLAFPTGEIH